jgi:hypothetical protein
MTMRAKVADAVIGVLVVLVMGAVYLAALGLVWARLLPPVEQWFWDRG